MSGTAGKREPLLWRRAAPRVSVCLARAPGESKRCERPQGASMYGDGVKYPHTVSEYWIQAGASMRILNTGLARYPKSIRVSMRLPGWQAHVMVLRSSTERCNRSDIEAARD